MWSTAKCARAPMLVLLVLLTACPGSDSMTGNDPGGSTKVRLTVVATGGSSVQFFDNQNTLHKCGDKNLPGSFSDCTADFEKGSQARIQRTLGLVVDEEAQWRLGSWGGACSSVDANVQPRGGICDLNMTAAQSVTVGFVKRGKVRVQQLTLNSPMSVRWSLTYSTQLAGGNPLTFGGTFDCNDPSHLPVCDITGYFDIGTTLTLTAGSGPNPAFWQNWANDCSTSGKNTVCVRTVDTDLTINGVWSFGTMPAELRSSSPVSLNERQR